MLLNIPEKFLPSCVQLLATADVLFTPYRRQFSDSLGLASAIDERRARYAAGGLPWTVGGDGASRVAGHRHIQALVSAGLVKSAGNGRDRSIRLTRGAEATTRATVASYVYCEPGPWALLDLVGAFTAAGHVNAGHVLEVDLTEINYDNPEFQPTMRRLAEYALPLLTAGLLDSNGDLESHIGYRITTAGKKALAAGCPEIDPNELPFDEPSADKYFDLLTLGLAERPNWQPESRSLVSIPLGAGSWPAPVEQPVQEVVNDV